jgi:hypothetical protein
MRVIGRAEAAPAIAFSSTPLAISEPNPSLVGVEFLSIDSLKKPRRKYEGVYPTGL